MAEDKQTLVHLVAEKAGISEMQAQIAVQTIAAFMKERLPDTLDAHVDTVLSTDLSPYSDHIDTALEVLGSFFQREEEKGVDPRKGG